MDRRQVPELGSAASRLGVDAVDPVDADHAPVLLALTRRPYRATDPIADTQAEATDLGGRNVNVIRRRHQAVAAHESKPILDNVEDAGGVGVTRELALTDQNLVDEIFLGGGAILHLQVVPDGLELVDAHPAQLVDVEVARVAVLEIVVFGHWRATRGASAGAAIARTRVGTVGRHRGRTRVGKVPCGLFARNRSAADVHGRGDGENTRLSVARQSLDLGRWLDPRESAPAERRPNHLAQPTAAACRRKPARPGATWRSG